jgi:pSer/pThr/pTyr-binding forkhead associated (FHA) protein
MKDFIKKLKKALGAETDDTQQPPVQVEPAPASASIPAPLPASRSFNLPPAPVKREEIIKFIVHSLRPYVNERNTGIKGLRLYVLCASKEEEALVNVALYADRADGFKNEELARKLSDNYISPDPNWFFEFVLVRDKLPDSMHVQGTLGLDVVKAGVIAGNVTIAGVTVISGQLEKEEYILDPKKKQRYLIGRSKNPILPSGAMQANDIVFINKDEPGFDPSLGASNEYVSRNHAVITFNPQLRNYFVAADKGGVPESNNKTKLFTATGKIVRLDIAGAAHELQDGDQLELGGMARLLFSMPVKSGRTTGIV